ncbi:MAG: DsrE family protein [Pseudomonadota bacterium]
MKTFIINNEFMGQGSPELGGQILASFFKKIATHAKNIEAIIFYNSGVKLVANDSPHLADLELVRSAGIDLLACGTCLNFYELSDKLAIGRPSNMQEICQMLIKADNVITL